MDRFFAMGAKRPGTNNGEFAGDAINKNIQKTTDGCTKNKDCDRIKNLQCINLCLSGRNTPQMSQDIYRLIPCFL